MRIIIAGSRDITDIRYVRKALKLIAEKGYTPSEVVCGMARGVDLLGKQWAEENDIPVKEFPAKWDDLKAPGANVRVNRWGNSYNATAGHLRNAEMAWYAAEEGPENGCLVAIWDGQSRGTQNMIDTAHTAGLEVHKFVPKVRR